jgi:hypothetical protein
MKSCGLILTVLALLVLAGCGGGGMTTQLTTYTISASVTGLSGGTLVLQNNSANNLSVTADGTYPIVSGVASGAAYAVTILTQPSGQTCILGTNASGTATANITVTVSCAANLTLSAMVTGLSGGSLILQDDKGGQLTFTSNGTQAFATLYPSGNTYTVSINTQPSGQTCTLGSNATGTITANTTVTVTCAATLYTISAMITGLSGGSLILQDDKGDQLTFTSNTTQAFATSYTSGAAYSVSIVTQPAGQICTLGSNASGNANSNITVAVTCVTPVTFTLSAMVSGLPTGSLALVDDQGDALTFTTNGTQTFLTPYLSGASYSVSISAQPSGGTCTLGSNASGTMTANTTVAITCVASFTIGGTVNGYTGTGLVLQNNGGNNLTVNQNATSFTFSTPIPSGSTYNVTVLTQPNTPTQTCTVQAGTGSGTVTNANITSVVINCTTNSYTIGGNVNGLTGSGLQLQDNNTDTLTINASGPFTFATKILSGNPYSVTVSTQPSGQSCTVTAFASGTVTNANITSVVVTCGAITTHNIWTWQNGTDTTDQAGIYTSKGATGTPGSRQGAVTWTDLSGNLWLFGGLGYDNLGNLGYLNDLWEYSPSANTWTWVAGSNSINQNGSYVSPFIPGARAWGVGWTDQSGNLWMFGGYGEDSNILDNAGPMNDLWKFTTGGTWNFIGGSDLINPGGTYGNKGSCPSGTTCFPGGRYQATGFVDPSGNFWMFSGFGFDSASNQGFLNDLWEFSGGLWTWQSGSKTNGAPPSYPTNTGTFGPNNVPGARLGSVSWIDSSGNFWLFGGNGIDSQNATGALNDLWEFNGSQWAWQAGANVIDQAGTYGAVGSAGTPGSRFFTSGWIDKSNNLWLFGGEEGLGSAEFNDLWEFTNGGWIWMNGGEGASSADNPLFGVYGTITKGTSSTTPGARELSVSWVDNSGNLWLFGGFGFATENPPDHLNDLWEYQP